MGVISSVVSWLLNLTLREYIRYIHNERLIVWKEFMSYHVLFQKILYFPKDRDVLHI